MVDRGSTITGAFFYIFSLEQNMFSKLNFLKKSSLKN